MKWNTWKPFGVAMIAIYLTHDGQDTRSFTRRSARCRKFLGWLACLVAMVATDGNAIDSAVCIKANGNGPLRFRAARPPASATCKTSELQLGSFDGSTLQLTGINL